MESAAPNGKVVLGRCHTPYRDVFAAFAEFERNLIWQRTLAGLKAARARGRKGGRPAEFSPEENT
jgi:DNA invertase Pin-like site-specific DNA recombinase